MSSSIHTRLISIVLLIFMGNSIISAQSKEDIILYYRFDNASVDSTYMSNDANISLLTRLLRGDNEIYNITLNVSSSPDGSIIRNTVLAEERAQSVKDMILTIGSCRTGFSADQISINVSAENWEGLLNMVRDQYWRHDREKVIDILTTENIGEETRKWRLQRLDDGYTWDFLRRNYMPKLRSAMLVKFEYAPYLELVDNKQVLLMGGEQSS